MNAVLLFITIGFVSPVLSKKSIKPFPSVIQLHVSEFHPSLAGKKKNEGRGRLQQSRCYLGTEASLSLSRFQPYKEREQGREGGLNCSRKNQPDRIGDAIREKERLEKEVVTGGVWREKEKNINK